MDSSWSLNLAKTVKYLNSDQVKIPTGFPTLDKLLRGGISTGQTAALFGRTAVGKSLVALNLAHSMSAAGIPSGFVSIEQVAEEVVLRLLSIYWQEEPDLVESILQGKAKNVTKLMQQAKEFHNKLFITDFSPSWDDVSRWLQGLKFRPLVVFVDHLKLMNRYGYPSGETQRIQLLTEDAKKFSKEERVALIIVHQAGRTSSEGTGEKNFGNKKLTMEDMLYGGEQNMDYIFGLYRPERNPYLSEQQKKLMEGKLFLQFLKNRHGDDDLDGFRLIWDKPSLKIQEG